MSRVVDRFAALGVPFPWRIADGQVVAANGARVWDFQDANDDPRVAIGVVALVNTCLKEFAPND
jgi:hypothetical protein